jgi:hypothetical protein
MLFGDAGTGDGGGPTLLFSFDNSDGGAGGWVGRNDNGADGATPTVITISSDGFPCPGALQVTLPLAAYGDHMETQFNYSPAIPVTATTVHMWLKLLIQGNAPDGSNQGLQDLQAFTQSHPPDAGPFMTGQEIYSAKDFSPPTAAGWQEAVFPLALDGGRTSVSLDQLGASALAWATADAGPLPSTTMILIDSVWIQ